MRIILLALLAVFTIAQAWPTNKWVDGRFSGESIRSSIPQAAQSRGAPVLRGELPHHVTILNDHVTVCSGSLINHVTVLTSPHCVVDSNKWVLHMGQGRDLQVMVSRDAVVHPNSNSIALIRLPVPITLTEFVRPIRLPTINKQTEELTDRSVIVSGIGTEHDGSLNSCPELRVADVTVLSSDVCKAVLRRDDVICLTTSFHQLPCNGDWGSAVVMYDLDGTFTQVAMVTRGQHMICDLGYPEIAIPLAEYVPWINENSGVH